LNKSNKESTDKTIISKEKREEKIRLIQLEHLAAGDYVSRKEAEEIIDSVFYVDEK